VFFDLKIDEHNLHLLFSFSFSFSFSFYWIVRAIPSSSSMKNFWETNKPMCHFQFVCGFQVNSFQRVIQFELVLNALRSWLCCYLNEKVCLHNFWKFVLSLVFKRKLTILIFFLRHTNKKSKVHRQALDIHPQTKDQKRTGTFEIYRPSNKTVLIATGICLLGLIFAIFHINPFGFIISLMDFSFDVQHFATSARQHRFFVPLLYMERVIL
jgi:hypothetical protein